MAEFHVEYLGRTQLVWIASKYLQDANPSGKIPVPIEDIVDLYEKIDIVPVEDLSAEGHEAYTAKDRKTIYVDKKIYDASNRRRIRFTLAHELSHLILHGYVFDAANYDSIDGFKEFLRTIPEDQVKTIESQAYKLAGLLLVPPRALSEKYSKLAECLEKQGSNIKKLTPQGLAAVANNFGEYFEVSKSVIHRCAVADGLWDWDDMPDG